MVSLVCHPFGNISLIVALSGQVELLQGVVPLVIRRLSHLQLCPLDPVWAIVRVGSSIWKHSSFAEA